MRPADEILKAVDFEKGGGLVPVVVQDAETREVLMVGYANREAIEKTIETGYAYFWSRSRKRLWMKGETSGNMVRVEEILVDCDGDAVIYVARPSGPVCHTGSRSCFFRGFRVDARLGRLGGGRS